MWSHDLHVHVALRTRTNAPRAERGQPCTFVYRWYRLPKSKRAVTTVGYVCTMSDSFWLAACSLLYCLVTVGVALFFAMYFGNVFSIPGVIVPSPHHRGCVMTSSELIIHN